MDKNISVLRTYGWEILFLRFGATLLDFIFLFATISLPWCWNGIHNDSISGWMLIIVVLCLVFYYPILEGYTGYTVGKFIVRLRVVREDGGLPGFVKALIRTLFRLIEVNPVLLGCLPAAALVITSRNRQRLGDAVAKTLVLKVKDVSKIDLNLSIIKKVIVGLILTITVLSPLLAVLGILLFPYDIAEIGF